MSCSSDRKQKKSVSSAASRDQVRANRRNAKKSTGPRTDFGKRVASLNAVTHGVFSKDAVLPGERLGEYVAFRNLLFASPGLMPQDWLECSIAEQYVLARWRIRRLQTVELIVHHEVAMTAAERQLVETEAIERAAARAADDDDDSEDSTDGGQGGEDAPRSMEQRLERSARAFELAEQMAIPIHTTMAAALTISTRSADDGRGGGGVDAFERIARNCHRLELSAARAMRELRQLRKDKGVDVSTLVGCPFLDPIPGDDGKTVETDEEREARASRERLEANLRFMEDLLARAEARDEANDNDDDDDDDDDAPHSDGAGGGVTSVNPSSSTDGSSSSPSSTKPQNAPSDAPAQNEANSKQSRAGDDAEEGCAQGSRRIEIVTPTKLGRRGADEASDDGKEDRDRT